MVKIVYTSEDSELRKLSIEVTEQHAGDAVNSFLYVLEHDTIQDILYGPENEEENGNITSLSNKAGV